MQFRMGANGRNAEEKALGCIQTRSEYGQVVRLFDHFTTNNNDVIYGQLSNFRLHSRRPFLTMVLKSGRKSQSENKSERSLNEKHFFYQPICNM